MGGNVIMECSEDRGIELNGLCFNYVDGNVTLTVFKNLPGITRELAGTIFQRSFSISEWEDINKYLMETLDKVEGVFVDDFDEDENEEEAKEAESSPLFEQIAPEGGEPITIHSKRIDSSVSSELPAMSNAEAILPENKVPAMTKEEMKEDGKEV